MYLLRLDDASEYMNIDRWKKMEALLDKYGIKPIFGIIPNNQDPELLSYGKVDEFWDLAHKWIDKGWIPAMHGYLHIFETEDGGINPVNRKSEFAGLPLEVQREKIRKGYSILQEHSITPDIFFAPAHTFDLNTLKALYKETTIRIISDTVAWDVYYKKPFYFIPQQSGRVRKLPFKVTTFCYHPNIMEKADFNTLLRFIEQNHAEIVFGLSDLLSYRKYSVIDKILDNIYFATPQIRKLVRGARN